MTPADNTLAGVFLLNKIIFMIHILYIGIGGFLGTICRYLISRFLNNMLPSFPLGTLAVNVFGSFLLGFVIYSTLFGKNIPAEMRDLLVIGFIGAFTTMSTFSYESFRLLELSEIMYSILNIILNVALSLIAVYLGKELAILISN
jgi:fluoride exporter